MTNLWQKLRRKYQMLSEQRNQVSLARSEGCEMPPRHGLSSNSPIDPGSFGQPVERTGHDAQAPADGHRSMARHPESAVARVGVIVAIDKDGMSVQGRMSTGAALGRACVGALGMSVVCYNIADPKWPLIKAIVLDSVKRISKFLEPDVHRRLHLDHAVLLLAISRAQRGRLISCRECQQSRKGRLYSVYWSFVILPYQSYRSSTPVQGMSGSLPALTACSW
ncbi:hypothetical protein BDV97DRAFT_168336 [Delphinella strobiligena]|nr:hypothetical protein BDV97DRAFT_168336 [Delphinella strobiligena]